MFKIFVSGHLKEFTGGDTEFAFDGEHRTVGEVLSALWSERAALRDRIINEQGDIRQHVNIFYDGRDVKKMDGLLTTIDGGSELHIFNAVSGG